MYEYIVLLWGHCHLYSEHTLDVKWERRRGCCGDVRDAAKALHPPSRRSVAAADMEAGLEAQASSYWHSRPSAPEPDGLPELHSSTQAPFSRYIELVHREQDTPPVP